MTGRRIFYVDVGNMPRDKAEAHLKKVRAQVDAADAAANGTPKDYYFSQSEGRGTTVQFERSEDFEARESALREATSFMICLNTEGRTYDQCGDLAVQLAGKFETYLKGK